MKIARRMSDAKVMKSGCEGSEEESTDLRNVSTVDSDGAAAKLNNAEESRHQCGLTLRKEER